MSIKTDIIIIGGGHAGCEAALAAARLGCEALLITMSLDTVAQMSCNPAIGGLAKGQLVREIDALGGAMALATDATGIQFRILNSSKGAAVQSPRAQADKWDYQHWMKHYLEKAPRVSLLQDRVIEIVAEGGAVVGVRTAIGLEIPCQAVVVCTGTFPRGKTHIGSHQAEGGRFGEPAAREISGSLEKLGLPLLRLKTGTCPRVKAGSIDFSHLTIQHGDEKPQPFSFLTNDLQVEQLPCHTTHTTGQTHAIVRAVLKDAPLFSGQIQGVGPRYCPSFELKLVRFPDKERHLIHIEPEGRHTEEMYLNGLATSLDTETQEKMLRSIPGLEESVITRYGYAVEYDAINSRALRDTLEVKTVERLYCAGQMNGTSGYEEAAAQGIYAGINAALKVQSRPPFRLDRSQAYIGVLIDDLVTRGTDEPYRLFTSRAEHRLILRHDNADLRLTPLARELGLVDANRYDRVMEIKREIEEARKYLDSVFHEGKSLAMQLRNPEISWQDILAFEQQQAGEDARLGKISARAAEQIEIETRYDGYIKRQQGQIAKMAKSENVRIPDGFDYLAISGLRNEAREKLSHIRPETLGQAGNISGVSPSDLALLAVRLKRRKEK
jgi:tRNA uridine 5-carboxymethylaminomethyl modification enzyme